MPSSPKRANLKSRNSVGERLSGGRSQCSDVYNGHSRVGIGAEVVQTRSVNRVCLSYIDEMRDVVETLLTRLAPGQSRAVPVPLGVICGKQR